MGVDKVNGLCLACFKLVHWCIRCIYEKE